MHGVPGDFSLPFLKYLKDSPVKWIGNCNELNAGYAADGYARMRGLGAICTTYGVGELSAINATAGSYAERVPVVNIVGMPSKSAWKQWDKHGANDGKGLIHHHLGGKQHVGVYRDMLNTVEIAHQDLWNDSSATHKFDTAIRLALQKQPVHVTLPSDMADIMVSTHPLQQPICSSEVGDPHETEELLWSILKGIASSARPLVMVDGMSERYNLRQEINEIVSKTGIPTVCLQNGLGIVNGNIPNYYGVYTGSVASSELQEYVISRDFVLLICPLLSDTGTAGWSAVPPIERSMWICGNRVRFRDRDYQVDAKDLLSKLIKHPQFKELQRRQSPSLPIQYTPASKAVLPPHDSPIPQDYLWPRLSSFFKPGDTLVLANGTPLIASRLFDLPFNVRVISSGLWFSIGSMLPATQGAALAQKDAGTGPKWSGRTILLEGDGSFQATAQELGTIIRYRLDCTILIVNNEGYAYERLIEGLTDDYNDVAAWKYTKFPEAFGGKSTPEYPIEVFTASKVGEMESILENEHVKKGKGLTLIEVRMGRIDVPSYFKEALVTTGNRLRGE